MPGLLLVAGFLVFLCFGGYLIGIPALTLAAPGLVPYLYLTDPAQFEAHREAWLAALAAAPVIATLLVRWASPRDGRLRARRPARRPAKRSPPKGNLRARRPPLLIGYLSRVGLLLALTSAVSLVLVFRDDDARATAELLDLIGGVLVTAVLVLAAVRRWDRPWVEPVTVEAVRSEVRRGERMLRRVQADNAKLARLVAEVESKLAAAGRRQEFASLRNLHGESFGCADRVHDHYRSVQTSLHTMSSILGRVRYAARQPLGLVNRSLSHQARADAAEMKAAAAGLADATARLDADTQRQLDLVRRLNARTADLKHTIRDACGPAGERWYAALEERKAAARLAEGKPARR